MSTFGLSLFGALALGANLPTARAWYYCEDANGFEYRCDDGLSGGAIAGITIGIIVAILFLCVGAYFLYRTCARGNRDEEQQTTYPFQGEQAFVENRPPPPSFVRQQSASLGDLPPPPPPPAYYQSPYVLGKQQPVQPTEATRAPLEV